MANVKITELTEATAPTTDDYVVLVDDPGGTPVTKRSTLANLLTVALTTIRSLTPAANKLPVYTSGSAAVALEITEQTVLGRLTGGIIKALSRTELTALLNAATTSLQGAAPLASSAEVIAGTDDAKIVTAAGITAKLDTDGTLAGNLDTRIPTQKATKTYVDTAAVAKALFDANTVLAANSDNTPAAVTIAEQALLGRVTGGNIAALTPAQILAGFVYERDNVIEDLSYLPPVTATWDPGNLVDGAGETSAAIPYPGVALGLFAIEAIAPYDLQGITCNAWVDAANSVKARLQNETAGTIDLASGTWTFQARRI